MRAYRYCRSVLFALAVFSVQAAAVPDWLEPMGGSGHGSRAPDVRAPLTAPVEVWGVDFDRLLGEPVVSSGVIYVVAASGRSTRLYALDLQTGEELDSESLSGESFGHVSVLGSAVIAVTDEAHYHLEHRGKAFKRGKVVRGTFLSSASLLPGLSAVVTSSGLQVLEIRSGKVLFEDPADAGKPLIVPGAEGGHDIYTVLTQDVGGASSAMVRRVAVQGAGTSQPRFETSRLPGAPGRSIQF